MREQEQLKVPARQIRPASFACAKSSVPASRAPAPRKIAASSTPAISPLKLAPSEPAASSSKFTTTTAGKIRSPPATNGTPDKLSSTCAGKLRSPSKVDSPLAAALLSARTLRPVFSPVADAGLAERGQALKRVTESKSTPHKSEPASETASPPSPNGTANNERPGDHDDSVVSSGFVLEPAPVSRPSPTKSTPVAVTAGTKQRQCEVRALPCWSRDRRGQILDRCGPVPVQMWTRPGADGNALLFRGGAGAAFRADAIQRRARLDDVGAEGRMQRTTVTSTTLTTRYMIRHATCKTPHRGCIMQRATEHVAQILQL